MKLIDFGVSVIEKEYKKEKDFYNRCTWPYSSPEDLLEQECSYTHDIWSLGIIFYYIIYDSYPFDAKSRFIALDNIFKSKGIFIKDKLDNNENFDKFKQKFETVNDYNAFVMCHTDPYRRPIFRVPSILKIKAKPVKTRNVDFKRLYKFENLFNRITDPCTTMRMKLKEIINYLEDMDPLDFKLYD